jgi:hypothetical protein
MSDIEKQEKEYLKTTAELSALKSTLIKARRSHVNNGVHNDVSSLWEKKLELPKKQKRLIEDIVLLKSRIEELKRKQSG